MVIALIAIANIAKAHGTCHILQFAIAIGSASKAIERMIGNIKLHHALADIFQTLGLSMDDQPFHCGCRAGGRSAIAAFNLDRQRRQEPNASTMSEAQSFGTFIPASMEARMIEVPSGTVTSFPSMVSVIIFSEVTGGCAVVDFLNQRHLMLLFRRYGGNALGAGRKSSGKCVSALMTG